MLNETLAKLIVTSAYHGILGRQPDAKGLDSWTNFLLDQKGSVEDLLRAFIESNEFNNNKSEFSDDTFDHENSSRFYFFHIPKTAGMSFHESLKERVGKLLFPNFFIKDLISSINQLNEYRFFSGHFLGFLDSILDSKTKKATLLRDPLERTISHYLHYIRDPSLPFHEAIKHKSLKNICKDHHLSRFINNYQSYYLSALISDSVVFSHTIELRQEFYDHSPNELYQRAQSAINEIEIIGIQEEFESFVLDVFTAWQLDIPQKYYRVNIANNKKELNIDSDTKKLIFQLTEIDYEIYNSVKNACLKRQKEYRDN